MASFTLIFFHGEKCGRKGKSKDQRKRKDDVARSFIMGKKRELLVSKLVQWQESEERRSEMLEG